MRRYQILSFIFVTIFIVNLYLLVSRRTTSKLKDDHIHTPIVMNHKDDSDEHLESPKILAQPPLISIIIPLYNQLRFLQDAVDSVLNQGFDDIEIIIVDDGSTEWSTRSTLNRMAEQHNGKVSVVFKTNGGLADARNAGMKVARGEWVLPLDADDLLGATFLSKAIQIIQTYVPPFRVCSQVNRNPSVNLVISDLMGVDANDPTQFVSEWLIPDWEPQELPKKNLLHCCPVFKRQLWLATDGYDPSMLFGWEDWEFWLRANLQIPIVPDIIPERLFKYRIKPGMHSFCSDYFKLCYAMLQSLHPELYPFEDILGAHKVIVQHKAVIQQPIYNKLSTFPKAVPLRTWNGLLKEASGDIQDAILEYTQAQRLTYAEVDWQPRFLIAIAKRKQGEVREGNAILDTLYAQFPDLSAAVEKVYGTRYSD